MVQWFISANDEVKGPYSTDDVQQQLRRGELSTRSQIWGKPVEHWMALDLWQSQVQTLLQNFKDNDQNRFWHYAYDGQSFGPYERSQLIALIPKLGDAYNALLWTKGMTSWAPIFEFHDIMDEVGLNRRKNSRAKISGQAIIEHDGKTLLGQLQSISMGGCGLTGLTQLQAGNEITLDLRSNYLFKSIRTKAEVRYVADNGFIGVRFRQISTEGQAAIMDYIRAANSKTKAAS